MKLDSRPEGIRHSKDGDPDAGDLWRGAAHRRIVRSSAVNPGSIAPVEDRSLMPASASHILLALAFGVLTSAAAGCRPRHIEAGPGGGIVVKSAQLGWYTKRVVTKQAPETLFAEDGTICRLSPERYRETAVGEMLYCNWQ